MKNYTPLSQFIDYQITKYELEDTIETRRKLKMKFMRTLKKLKIWDNAETKLIGKKITRVFSEYELYQLYQLERDYLLYQSKLNTAELQEYINNYYNNKPKENHDDEDMSYYSAPDPYAPPTVTTKEIKDFMLEAIFNIFYGKIDIKQWNRDKETTHILSDDEDFQATDIDYIAAIKRLNNPIKSYTKRKK